MYIFEKIAEQRILEAMERGEFDNLPLKGKPLPPDDLAGVPDDMRLAVKIMKNAGILPEEMLLRKEILNLQKLIEACDDDEEICKLRKEMNAKQLRYNILMESRKRSIGLSEYRSKILKKLR
ncbi:MAG: DUF1992 domain-containing protein [Spirochaetes bacterium]|nr:DUF1992 domain-containing protein [Spirochaetota bacterium]